MPGGTYDGEIRLNADMQTTGVEGGAKEIQSAMKSLIRSVNDTDKSMRKSLTGYAEAMKQNETSTRNYAAELQNLKQSASEIEKAINASMGESEEYRQLKESMRDASAELEKYKAKREQLASQNAQELASVEEKEEELGRLIEEFTSKMQEAASQGKDTSGFQRILDAYNSAFDKLLDRQDELMNARDSGALFADVDESIKRVQGDMEELAKAKEEMIQSGNTRADTETTTALREQLQVINNQIDAIEKAAQSTSEYRQQLAEIGNLDGTSQVEQNLEGVGNTLDDINERKKRAFLAPDIEKWNSMTTLSGIVKNAFAKAVESAKAGAENVRSAVAATGQKIGTVGYAFQHPFQALDRILGTVATSVPKLAQVITSVLGAAIRTVGTLISSLAHAITNVLGFALRNAVSLIKTLASALLQLGQHVLQLAGNLARMVGAAVLTGLRNLASLAETAMGGILKIADAAKNAAVQLGKMVGGAIMSGLKRVGSYALDTAKSMLRLGNNTRKSSSAFQMGFKQILRYGLGVRSTYALVNKLRRALVDSINSLVKESPRLNTAMSSMSSALKTLKNSIATAFEPIITAVAPYVTKFLQLITAAMTKIGEFFALLTGQNTIFKAKNIYEDYAKSLDKTSTNTKKSTAATKKNTKSVKENNKERERQLASFDELNILTDTSKNDKTPTNSSASTAGADAAANANKKLFDETPLTDAFSKWFKKLISLFKAGKYEEIGKILADKINGIFKKLNKLLNWNKVGKKITKFINGITRTFNSLVKNIKWKQIGKTIADAANVILNSMYLLLTGIDWDSLGSKLGEGASAFLNGVDWDTFGATLALRMTIALRMLANAVLSFDWKSLGRNVATGINSFVDVINDVLGDIDFEEAGRVITEGLNNLVNNVSWNDIGVMFGEMFESALNFLGTILLDFDWAGLAKGLSDGFNSMLYVLYNAAADFEWERLVKNFTNGLNQFLLNLNWTGIGAALGGGIQTAIDMMLVFVDTFKWGEHGKNFADAVNSLWKEIKPKSVGNLLAGAIHGAFEFLYEAASTFKWGDHGAKFGTAVRTLVDRLSKDKPTLGEVLKSALDGALNFMLGALTGFLTPTDEKNFEEECDKLTTDEKVDALGKLLGEMIEKALKKMVEKLTNWDGADAGAKFARRLGRFFKNKDRWALAGQAIGEAAKKLMDFATAFAENFNAREAGNAVRTLLLNIPWMEIAEKVWSFVKTTFGKAGDFVSALLGLDIADDAAGEVTLKAKWIAEKTGKEYKKTTSLAQKLGKKLSDVFGGITADDLKDGLSNMITQIKNFIKKADEDLGITESIKGLVDLIPWATVFTKELFDKMWTAIEPRAKELAVNLMNTLKEGIDEALSGNPLYEIPKFIGSGLNGIWRLGEATVGDAVRGAKGMVDQLIGSASGLFGGVAYAGELDFTSKLDGTTDETGFDQKWTFHLGGETFTANVETETDEKFGGPRNKIARQILKGGTIIGEVETEVDGTKDGSGTKKKIGRALKENMTGHVITNVDGTTDASAAPEKIQKAYDSEDLLAGVEVIYHDEDAQDFYSTYIAPLESGIDTPVGLKKSGWESITGFLGIIKNKAVEVPVKIVNAVGGAVNKVGDLFSGLFGSNNKSSEVNASDISGPYTKGATDAKAALDSIKTAVGNMKSDVSTKLSTLATSLKTTSESLKNSLTTTLNTAFTTIKVTATTTMTAMKVSLTTTFSTLKTSITTSITTLKTSVDTAFTALGTSIKTKVTAIKTNATTTFTAIKTNLTNQANQAKNNVGTAFDGMKTKIKNAMSSIKTAVSNQSWYNVGANIVKGISDGINGWWGWLNDSVWNLAIGLYNTACWALGIHSPSKLFADGVGKNVSLGIAQGIENAGPAAICSINVLTDDMAKQMARMDAIGSSVTFRTPDIALGNVLPYNVQANVNGASDGVSEAITASNDELSNVIIQAVNNATIAVVQAIETYSTTNVNIDKRSLTDVIVEEINRRTKAQGSSPLLV